MARYEAGFRFSTVLQLDGSNTLLAAAEGDPIELSDSEFAALDRDLPGAAIPVKTATKKATTKQGKGKTARTRQVVKDKE